MDSVRRRAIGGWGLRVGRPRILTAPGPVLFITGLVLLAPGGLLSLVIVEKLLWSSQLPLSGMTWAELVVTLAINAALWWSVAKAWKAIRSRRPVVADPERLSDRPNPHE